MNLAWIDYLFIAVVLVSTLMGLWRGLIRESLSLVGWILAFWVATQFSYLFAPYLADLITTPSLQLGVAFGLLFVAVLFLSSLVTVLICQVVDATGLTGTDRTLGMIFGFGRGALAVAVLVMLAGLTPLPQDPWWQESVLIPQVQPLVDWVKQALPEGIAAYFVYE